LSSELWFAFLLKEGFTRQCVTSSPSSPVVYVTHYTSLGDVPRVVVPASQGLESYVTLSISTTYANWGI